MKISISELENKLKDYKENVNIYGKTYFEKKENAKDIIDFLLHEIISKRRAINHIKETLSTILFLTKRYGLKKEYRESIVDAINYFIFKLQVLGC